MTIPFPRRAGPARGLRLASVFVILGLAACDGSNLFEVPGRPDESNDEVSEPEPDPESDPVLRFVEEGTLLQDDDDRLRFRWDGIDTLRVDPGTTTTGRERDAIRSAMQEFQGLPVPSLEWAPGGGESVEIVFRAFPPDEYREHDSTRPWSFSRSFVTAREDRGIMEVEILLSLDLPVPVLERAVLHGLGHAMGIMGHPAFPGATHVMAVAPGDDEIPTRFAPLEREAFRFLYSPEVRPGMTRSELREAFREWDRP